jgi:hypothetical protein
MNNTNDIGIVVLNLSSDKENINLIQLAHECLDTNPYNQICFFSAGCDIVSNINMPIFHMSHAKFFYGNIIVTDLQSLELSLSFTNINKILFWCSNIPWQEKNINYKYWETIFLDDRVNIIAKNTQIYDLFEICYKQPITIAERLSYEEIKKCL